MKELLSFDQAPPIDVPFRFIFSAVPFGILAGLLLMASGGQLSSRWTPQSLALTHLFTTGFMLQAMCGALFQLTPVAIGANVWRPRLAASLIHPALVLGALCLAWAFLAHDAILFKAAAALLGLGSFAFIALMATALQRSPARNPSRNTLRLALLGLLVTAAMGLALALARSGSSVPEAMLTTTQHLRFGWIGWGLMLLAGASYLVVPMFQLTPQYPARFQQYFAATGFAILCTSLLAPIPPEVVSVALALTAGAYAGVTLRLQSRRRRPRIDTSFRFWRVALASTVAASALTLALPMLADPGRFEVLLGILVLAGGFSSVICAMVYKIVPFLVWLHLNKAGGRQLLMHQVVEETHMTWHYRAHVAALLLALPVPWWAEAALPAGGCLVLAHLLQARSLIVAWRRYLEGRAGEVLAAQP